MPARGATARRRGGNPPFTPTDEQRTLVMVLAGCGYLQKDIATRLKISPDTIQRHLKDEWEQGRNFAASALAEVMYKQGMKGDVQAAREWFDRRGGPDFRRRTASEHSGPDGSPIQLQPVPVRRDLSQLTVEELELLEQLTAKLEKPSDAPAD